MYLLDTNTCIFIKNGKSPQVLQRLHQAIGKKVYISSITVAELQYGVYNSQNIEKNRISLTQFLAPFFLLNFDDDAAEEFGRIRAYLKHSGIPIGPYDMLIAAQAISKNLILVTNNRPEFSRIQNLKLEDWK